jgi:hypothetical protein
MGLQGTFNIKTTAFIHSPADELKIVSLAIKNNAAMNIHVQVSA